MIKLKKLAAIAAITVLTTSFIFAQTALEPSEEDAVALEEDDEFDDEDEYYDDDEEDYEDEEEEIVERPLPPPVQTYFTNTVSSNVIDIYSDGSTGSGMQVAFDGIFNEVTTGFRSERIEAGITGKFGISRYNITDQSTQTALGLSWVNDAAQMFRYDGYDWFIDYRAFPWMSVIFSDDVYIFGSYLPVFNGNIESGNLGSDFGVMFNLLNNDLRIGLGVDFGLGSRTTQTTMVSGLVGATVSSVAGTKASTSTTATVTTAALSDGNVKGVTPATVMVGNTALYSSKKVSDVAFDVDLSDISKKAPGINFGFEYDRPNSFGFGLVGRNLLKLANMNNSATERWTVGAYGHIIANNDMLFTFGFSTDDDGVFGDYFVVDGFLLSFGFAASSGKLDIAFDFVTALVETLGLKNGVIPNRTGNTTGFDVYAALSGTYHFSPSWSINLILRGTGAMAAGYSAFFEAYPNVKWQLNRRHSFGLGADIIATSGYYNINFPLYWSYRM